MQSPPIRTFAASVALPVLVALLATGATVACSSDSSGSKGAPSTDPPDAAPSELVLTSPAFEEGGTIPPAHRCANTPSPPFEWSGGPEAGSYAIVMRDLDFQSGFLHWVIYDIPGADTSLPEGVPLGYQPTFPAGARQAPAIGAGYFGPCSPATVNTYQFTLYALDVPALTEVTEETEPAAVVAAIEARAIAQATLSGESGP